MNNFTRKKTTVKAYSRRNRFENFLLKKLNLYL